MSTESVRTAPPVAVEAETPVWQPTSVPAGIPIGVFDSGLGGLTVLRSLIDLLADIPTIYFGDTARFPYGTRSPDELIEFSREIASFLVQRGAGLIVVACNSAASAALEVLRSELEIPVIGVIEPGVRSAAKVTRSGRVGVIGTVGTISSGAYQRAIERLAPTLDVTYAACPGFVEFVEEGDVDSDQARVLAERLLAPVVAADVDTLVLGCTHYPLLARTIGDVMGRGVVLVSSGEETSFEVMNFLHDTTATSRPMHTSGTEGQGIRGQGIRGQGADSHATGARIEAPGADVQRSFVTSGDPVVFARLGTRFLGPEVTVVERHVWR